MSPIEKLKLAVGISNDKVIIVSRQLLLEIIEQLELEKNLSS